MLSAQAFSILNGTDMAAKQYGTEFNELQVTPRHRKVDFG